MRPSVSRQQTSAIYVICYFLFLFSYLSIPIFLPVSSFFSSSRTIFSSLPSVVTWLAPQFKKCVTATESSQPVKTMQGVIMYLCGLKKNRKKGSNSSLLFRKSCLWLLANNVNNRNATGKHILTWMGKFDGDKSKKRTRLDSFTHLMRTWLSTESDLASVELHAVFEYWQKHEQLPKVKGTPAKAAIRPSALKTGPKPINPELEIAAAEWVEQQSALKNLVSLLSVIK